ncbi:hypothetical protein IF1G_05126 [Cordyceps javanica]|uniref:Uncharacterized protein n=1 Tax=Cordyceps javanica TaxID=43265 RepID=A0A545V4A0_9HYPO|nr:hypothetical protein IF1G_05126 [Cordyceps javanica]
MPKTSNMAWVFNSGPGRGAKRQQKSVQDQRTSNLAARHVEGIYNRSAEAGRVVRKWPGTPQVDKRLELLPSGPADPFSLYLRTAEYGVLTLFELGGCGSLISVRSQEVRILRTDTSYELSYWGINKVGGIARCSAPLLRCSLIHPCKGWRIDWFLYKRNCQFPCALRIIRI